MRYHFDEELSDILILHKYKNINYLHDELAKFIDKKLKQENARLREALSWYAQEIHWTDKEIKKNMNWEEAQKALEGTK